jgi:hypothetical protein
VKQKGFASLIIIIILTLVGVVGYLAYQNTQLRNVLPTPTQSPISVATNLPTQTIPTVKPTTDPTASWKEHTDGSTFLKVKYPSSWRVVDWTNGYGFGPQEIGEDVLWGVNYYGKSDYSQASVLGEIGKQFSDRKQTTKTIDINGIKALEVITTTPSIPSWYSDTILLEYGTTYITLSNGAISDSDLQKMKGVPAGTTFKYFYSTIKFMNE